VWLVCRAYAVCKHAKYNAFIQANTDIVSYVERVFGLVLMIQNEQRQHRRTQQLTRSLDTTLAKYSALQLPSHVV
jgi:hypothetical protein